MTTYHEPHTTPPRMSVFMALDSHRRVGMGRVQWVMPLRFGLSYRLSRN